MDIRGPAGILLNFILNTIVSLLKNSDDSQADKLTCDSCGELKSTVNMHQVCGGICVCEQCVEIMLTVHIITHPLKILCPYCYGENNNTEKCHYCNLPSIPEETSGDN